MDSTTIAILGTLGGALVATVGTLLAQRLAGRDADRRTAIERQEQRREGRRSELKRATEALFLAAERAQSACDAEATGLEKRAASDQLWAAFKSLSLISSDTLTRAAAEYSDGLNSALWQPDGQPAWERVLVQNRAFSGAARDELKLYDA